MWETERQKIHRRQIYEHLLVFIVVILCLLITSSQARAGYWIKLWKTGSSEEAAKVANTIDENWETGGRLSQVLIRKVQGGELSATSYKVYVGVYSDVSEAVKMGIHILRKQPWRHTGVFCPNLELIVTGSFNPIGIQFTSGLAEALKSNKKNSFPYVAEALTATVFGFSKPNASIPDLVKSTTQIKAWQRVLVLSEKSVCLHTKKLIGGTPPKGSGQKGPSGPPIVHQEGKRCMKWLYAMSEHPLALAWFPAANLVKLGSYKEARAQSRWGPVNYRYQLNRIGSSPAGIVYQGVFRTGAFAPVIERIVVAKRFPEPHRLVHDKLGFAIYEGKGLVVERLTVSPPPPGVSPLWKKEKSQIPRHRYTPRKIQSNK